jgi:hypothetical protein
MYPLWGYLPYRQGWRVLKNGDVIRKHWLLSASLDWELRSHRAHLLALHNPYLAQLLDLMRMLGRRRRYQPVQA